MIFQQMHRINRSPWKKSRTSFSIAEKGIPCTLTYRSSGLMGSGFHTALRVHLDRVNRIQWTQKHRVQVIVQFTQVLQSHSFQQAEVPQVAGSKVACLTWVAVGSWVAQKGLGELGAQRHRRHCRYRRRNWYWGNRRHWWQRWHRWDWRNWWRGDCVHRRGCARNS